MARAKKTLIVEVACEYADGDLILLVSQAISTTPGIELEAVYCKTGEDCEKEKVEEKPGEKPVAPPALDPKVSIKPKEPKEPKHLKEKEKVDGDSSK